MKITLRCAFMLLSTLFLATSCLNTDDTEYTYYNDTAITAFSLGTLNRYYIGKTKYTDEDSTYKTTVTGSDYEFYIDQTENKIYNNDSLPKGTDAAHVICSVSSKNSGVVIIKYQDTEGEDSLAYYSSSDSVDFSVPREFRVYASDGSAYRSYTVNVNVHEEEPDSFKWNVCSAVDGFKTLAGMKAVSLNGKVLLLGSDGSKTTVYSTDINDGKSWTKVSESLGADAYKNTAVLGEKLYSVSDGSLVSTSDGTSWTEVGPFSNDRLLGAGSKKLYAKTADGKIAASADNGATWTNEDMDGTEAQMPVDALSLAALPVATNDSTENIVLAGLRDLSVNSTDTAAVIWGKVEEYETDAETNRWVRYESEGGYELPSFANVTMIKYGSVLLALGGSPQGGASSQGFTYLYISEDKGLTWHTDTEYVLPENFSNGTSDTFAVTADNENVLWIICGGTGQVWRGRLNKLGWKTWQTSFTK